MAPRKQVFRRLRALLVDGVAPVALYYALRALGVADLPAVMAGGAVAAADALVSLAVERRLRFLPIYVCAAFVLTGAVAWATGDPRVLLVKASIATAAIGLYVLALAARPKALGRLLDPLIARGSEARAERWRAAWPADASLRARMRLACALGGLALIAEAAGRAAIVFSFTVGQSLILAHAPAIVLVAALALIIRFLVTPAVVGAMSDLAQRPAAQQPWLCSGSG
jgi:hypothetical protein